ncbi:MAG: protein-L-isoaspartate(D-aspartate) O-methyltransferase [Terriglobales bacterium]
MDSSPVQVADSFHTQRIAMVELQLRTRGIRDPRVLAAMQRVPRHEFLAPEFQREAYEDRPLPIGHGQTVSQPYIVAAMLEALELQPADTVLEIGTGSGYQTALLAELAGKVYSIERHAPLAERARQTLERLGYMGVEVLVGDGTEGLPSAAPFDAILVSAAAPKLPPPLLEQLAEGGRMIVPVGFAEGQELELVRKQRGQPLITRLDACRFVPLIGREGFPSGW